MQTTVSVFISHESFVELQEGELKTKQFLFTKSEAMPIELQIPIDSIQINSIGRPILSVKNRLYT